MSLVSLAELHLHPSHPCRLLQFKLVDYHIVQVLVVVVQLVAQKQSSGFDSRGPRKWTENGMILIWYGLPHLAGAFFHIPFLDVNLETGGYAD